MIVVFKCIMEEANLMLEVFKRNVVNADKYMIEMIQREFEFGYDIRSAALDILTKYKGPYCNEVSASLLVCLSLCQKPLYIDASVALSLLSPILKCCFRACKRRLLRHVSC
jgi:hypothetical protein